MNAASRFCALLFRNRLAGIGALILLTIIAVSLAAPLLPLQDPNLTAPAKRLLPPLSEAHWLGTDHLGRDLLSRLLHGTRLSIAVGVGAALISACIGSVIGITAGFIGGKVDVVFMRSIDSLMAFPYILLALAIVAALGPGLLNAVYAVAIVNIPFFARNVRGVTLNLVRREFVDAARLCGMSQLRIIMHEILPHVLPVIVIAVSTTIGWIILETAGLSFLGLGSQPPQADLGSMLGEGRKLLINAPHASLVPGLMIFLIVMCINLVGDGVRDVLDPRLSAGALSRPAPVTTIERGNSPPPAKTTGVLSATHLHTEFQVNERTYHAVSDVEFQVNKGECLGIVGESGSGKSVSALSLLGLVASPPGVITQGTVSFEGKDLFSGTTEDWRRIRGRDISCVFQDPLTSLHPLMTVEDQLVEAIRVHRQVSYKDARVEIIELLRQVKIPNPSARLRHYPHELSGGMRQRVAIAMALANNPKVLIADEPTTALDVTVQAEVLAVLRDLQHERDLAMIFITHDFAVVAKLCDRIAVMYAGKMVEIGDTHDVLNAPQHPYTAQLIACVPQFGDARRRLTAIPGNPPDLSQLTQGCAFAARCNQRKDECEAHEIGLRSRGGRQVRCSFPLESVA